ncbi:MAG: c-type cytochrome [Hyphomicrobiaceae bacterium]
MRMRWRLLTIAVALVASDATLTSAFAQTGGDAVRGRHVYRKCAVCHVNNPGSTALLAPPLNDIVGRKAATYAGFEYSEIMKLAGTKGLIWTREALYYFLDRPEQFIPGTYMAFAGLEAQERNDVIAYLESLQRASARQGQKGPTVLSDERSPPENQRR